MPENKDEIIPEVIQTKKLPDKERHVLQTSFSYSGPIPPPELFAGYEKALPGLADRVMSMSESQTAHRIQIETRVVKADSLRSILGLIFAFIIVIVGMILGAYLLYKDKPISGFVAMITPLGVVVGAFLLQNKKNSDKNKPKEETPEK
jgi:uncharacterized membrane protein